MAPRIAKGKVIVGPAGGDRPTRGFFAAYDAETGHEVWRFYTVPGDPAKGFESLPCARLPRHGTASGGSSAGRRGMGRHLLRPGE